jgi:HAD superfamily hydrolase (TIGR01450 family)
MDGTIYVDEQLVPGAERLLGELERRGIARLFVTNNSAARAEDYQARLGRLGIRAARDEIMTSGDATIAHLLARTPHRSAYVVGTPALEDAFVAGGVRLDDRDPDCVVVGFDRTLTYAKLERACRFLFAGKPYFATHPDKTCITKDGLIPDIAAIIAACEAVTGRRPQILGKPEPEMVAAALGRLGHPAAVTGMVGDQLDTDLTMARRAGLLGVLVLSGETRAAQVDALPPDERPALVVRDVGALAELLL